MEMDNPAFYNPAYSKQLAVNNAGTCIYFASILLWLHRSGTLYDIEKYQGIVPLLIFAAEILKYLLCWRLLKKSVKGKKQSSIRIIEIAKCTMWLILVLAGSIALTYIIAVLLGAPFLSKFGETFTFSLMIAILVATPCCLHLGPLSVPELFFSLTYFEGNETYEKFLINLRLTIFGSWCSAVVIPLDWNRPFQKWPIPCILGSILGCFCANFYLFALYFIDNLKQKKKKTFKV